MLKCLDCWSNKHSLGLTLFHHTVGIPWLREMAKWEEAIGNSDNNKKTVKKEGEEKERKAKREEIWIETLPICQIRNRAFKFLDFSKKCLFKGHRMQVKDMYVKQNLLI